jgi:TonB family protein
LKRDSGPTSFAKVDLTSTLLAAGQRLMTPSTQTGEDRLLSILLAVSAVVHLVFIFTDDFSWMTKPTPLVQEWELDADLISDVEFAAPPKSALPKAEPAPEARVPQEMLPQLTKKMAVEEEKQEEEAISEEAKPVEPPKDVPKAPEEVKAPDIPIKSDEDVANKIKKEDALKRLALERLRQEEKTAKTLEAPEDDPLARIARQLSTKKNLNAGAAGGPVTGKAKRYMAMLQQAVRQNYSLPEAYNLKAANLFVLVEITVGERGDLANLAVSQPSGDPMFDELTVQSVRASTPLPKPPLELAGQPILLKFTP